MTIDETITELQKFRDFVNPNANIVKSISLNVDRFAAVEIKSEVDDSSIENLSSSVDELEEKNDHLADELDLSSRMVKDLAEAVRTLLPTATHRDVMELKSRLNVIQKVENGEI